MNTYMAKWLRIAFPAATHFITNDNQMDKISRTGARSVVSNPDDVRFDDVIFDVFLQFLSMMGWKFNSHFDVVAYDKIVAGINQKSISLSFCFVYDPFPRARSERILARGFVRNRLAIRHQLHVNK